MTPWKINVDPREHWYQLVQKTSDQQTVHGSQC